MKAMSLLGGLSLMVAAGNTSAAILAGPIYNPANGHEYFLLTPTGFADGEAQAVALGGHLVTVNNLDENIWLVSHLSFFDFVPRPLGLGFNDTATEGTFVWTSGEAVTFTNWAQNQPDNNGPNLTDEDWAYLIESDANGGLGAWNDIPVLPVNSIFPVVERVAVPEPSAIAILLPAAAGLLRRRR